jgi:hypothetical protein
MLLTQVKMNQSLLVGEFVQWSSSENQFIKCTDHMQMMGVVDQPPELVGSDYVGVIRQAGVASAIAGEDIPEQGGALGINSEGRAIISTAHSCGIIQAQPYGQSARVAGDRVVIWLR